MSYITMLTVRGCNRLANGGYPLIKGLPPNATNQDVRQVQEESQLYQAMPRD